MLFKKLVKLTMAVCAVGAGALTAYAQGGHPNLCVQTHFGHVGWEKLESLKKIKELGVGWIRDDIYWNSVEKEKGKYEIPKHVWDWINEANKQGLKIIAILNGSNKIYKDPYDHEAYVNYARFMAKALKGHVHAMEIINEPFNHYRHVKQKLSDAHSAWNGWNAKTGETDEWVKQFVKTQNAAADAIYKEAPGEYKILGVCCSPPLNVRILKLGMSKHIDGMVIHPYSYKTVPELQMYGSTDAFVKRDGPSPGDKAGTFVSINRDLMKYSKEYNGPKELWITELGYQTASRNYNKDRFGGFSEEAQAKYALRHFMECLGTNVELVSWYAYNSRSNNPFHGLSNFGIVYNDGTPKPAYYAIQRLAKKMIDYKASDWGKVNVYFGWQSKDPFPITWDGSIRETFGTPRAYTFVSKDGKQRAVALWSSERAWDFQGRTAEVVIQSDRKAKRILAYDLYNGRTSHIRFKQNGDKITIGRMVVPDRPVLLMIDGEAPVKKHIVEFDMKDKSKLKAVSPRNIKTGFEVVDDVVKLNFKQSGKKGGYAGVQGKLEITESTPIFAFKGQTNKALKFLVRVYDATGQTHQYKVDSIPSRQLEDYKIDLTKAGSQNWGGKNDKKIHYPIKGFMVGLETNDFAKLDAEFSDIKVF